VRPSKVASYNGWESRPVRLAYAPGASHQLINLMNILDIIEHPGTNGIYHITSDNPPDISTLAEYCERFLGVRGIQVLWNQSGKNTNPNPAEELFNKLFEQYRPYLSDNRIFDQSRTQTLTQGAPAPLFTYDIFEKCMAYAVACDWGNIRGFPK
jgi:hypothetical protein